MITFEFRTKYDGNPYNKHKLKRYLYRAERNSNKRGSHNTSNICWIYCTIPYNDCKISLSSRNTYSGYIRAGTKELARYRAVARGRHLDAAPAKRLEIETSLLGRVTFVPSVVWFLNDYRRYSIRAIPAYSTVLVQLTNIIKPHMCT